MGFEDSKPQTFQPLGNIERKSDTSYYSYFLHLGSQSNLNEVIENLVAVKQSQVKRTQCFLYMIHLTAKKLAPSLLNAKKLSPSGGTHDSM